VATVLAVVSRRVDVGKLLESLGIQARQRGDEWRAVCPNPDHDDHRPSWRIVDDPRSERHSVFHCYPCGFRGDAITLVRMMLGVGYHAACAWIDEFAPPEEGMPTARVEIAEPKIFRMPAGVADGEGFYDWPTPFRRYLEGRNIPEWQVARWGLAYAIEGRLSGRIVIPTRNSVGRLLSYTARAIGEATTRYLTPSREEGADGGAVFGEEHWGPTGGVIVAEGAFDALACERAMPGWAIGVTGTGGTSYAADPRVLMKLGRFDELVVITDADAAGDRAFLELKSGLPDRKVVRARPPSKEEDAAKMDPTKLRGIIEAARRR
jgi:DNA primase